MARHRAQLVLNLIVSDLGPAGRLGLFYFCLNRFCFLRLCLGTGWLRLFFYSFRLGERCTQVGTAIGAKLDAVRQLLAAMMAKLGAFLLSGCDACGMAVGCVTVVMHDKGTVNVTAHGKALGAHNLTVMDHKFLL